MSVKLQQYSIIDRNLYVLISLMVYHLKNSTFNNIIHVQFRKFDNYQEVQRENQMLFNLIFLYPAVFSMPDFNH